MEYKPRGHAAGTVRLPLYERDRETVPFVSGGLGLSRTDWERDHGPPVREVAGFVHYGDETWVVAFMEGSVWHIERTYGDREAASPELARDEGMRLMPPDAQFIRGYSSPSGQPVHLYVSESLKGRFSSDRWTGGQPGNFIVLNRTRTTDDRVTSLVIGLGDNP
jgi:hypothetical protein